MKRAFIVLEKEWLEIRLQRTLLLSTFLLPPAVTLLVLGLYTAAALVPAAGQMNLPPGFEIDPALRGMSPREIGQTLVGKQFSIMFMLLPIFIPSVIASYAVVGEKRDRTLEPLLATPVRTWELLAGKTLASLVPTLAITFACAAAFAAGIWLLALSPRVAAAVLTPGWALFLLFDVPFLALVGIALVVLVSSRVNDPRSAQQISAILVVPIIGLVLGNLSGALTLSPALALAGAGVLAVLAVVALRFATQMFQRETILIRWK